MAGLLGEEFEPFAQSYGEATAVGLRVNTLKLSAADFSTLSPFTLKAVGPHEPDGFLVTDDSKPGSHPYHAAGLYYLPHSTFAAAAMFLLADHIARARGELADRFEPGPAMAGAPRWAACSSSRPCWRRACRPCPASSASSCC